jgi:hypothetical protein
MIIIVTLGVPSAAAMWLAPPAWPLRKEAIRLVAAGKVLGLK